MIPAKYWSPTKKLMMLGAMAGGKLVEDTATGNPLTFITDASKPLKSLLVPFLPVQSGSGDPSPQNIRPIVAWDGLTVWNGGANLFDGNYVTGLIQNTAESAWYRNTGTSAKSAIIPCRPNTQYTIHKIGYDSSNRFSIGLTSEYPENNMPVTLVVEDSGLGEKQRTFTTGANDHFIIVYVSTGAEMAEPDMMVNFGSLALPYVPYAPITETDISFPSPVYGGTLDVVSGVLTVEWVSLTKTWGDFLNKTSLGDNTRGVYSISSFPSLGTGAGAMCNIAPRKLEWSQDVVHFYTNEGSCIVFLPNETANSTEIQVVYPLATPQEITLTPEQITALLGNNTIWSDANGSMTAVFLKKG